MDVDVFSAECCGLHAMTFGPIVCRTCGELMRLEKVSTFRKPPQQRDSIHRIGTLFAQRFPDLHLRRKCSECQTVLSRMDCSGLATDPDAAALAIVCNANRTALRQFGHDRETQRAAIAAAIRELIENARTTKTFTNAIEQHIPKQTKEV